MREGGVDVQVFAVRKILGENAIRVFRTIWTR
jgi:hypothetical protein